MLQLVLPRAPASATIYRCTLHKAICRQCEAVLGLGGDFYRLRIGGLDRADALLLLSELLRLRVQSAPPRGIARGRLEGPAALAELAEAADGSPSLLRTAITLLKQPGDWDAALRRLRELSQQYQQQTAPPPRPAAAPPKLLGSVENELVSHLLDIRNISTGIGAPALPWPEGSDGSFVGIGIGDLPPQSLTDSAASELLRGAAGTPVKRVRQNDRLGRGGRQSRALESAFARHRQPAPASAGTAKLIQENGQAGQG